MKNKQITMKIALIADVHANLEAFTRILKETKKRKIRKILCLGDIVDYGANSNECIELIRKNKIPTLMGNHDLNAVTLERIEWFNSLAQISCKLTNKLLIEKNKKFLLKLPKTMKYENIFLVHGSPRDYLYDYTYPETPDSVFDEFFKIAKKKIIVMGHTHIPFIKKIKKGLIINAGSVGQPRDGNNKACFCILDNKKLKAEIVRVKYDVSKAAKKIIRARMPHFHASRLFQGI